MNWFLVRSVSRSLYLSLRLLPRSVQTQITLAYLLARASDTIADTPFGKGADRLEALQCLRRSANDPTGQCDSKMYLVLARSQDHPAERQLLEHLPTLIESLHNQADADVIREVLDSIMEGQMLDLERPYLEPFTREQLDRYTFLVAGCVGRFWTRICYRRIPQFASLSAEDMEELGVLYGKGLQLVNILRDRDEDASVGRLYISAEDVKERFWEAWMAMQSGVKYGKALSHPFLRYATLLPALIGVRTLKLIRSRAGKTKISRREVRCILIKTLPFLWRAEPKMPACYKALQTWLTIK
ncbi:MAG: squalene/phytoene synthase family protein [Candidatus Xiphinematobacter sp.]|nr:MAG: squalene/phytoene synthase family protein [Candidatus Xiphinematobacter sp.]